MSGNLVIGASGQVGEHLMNHLRKLDREVTGTCHEHYSPGLVTLDIRDNDAIDSLVDQSKPEVIYLTAALTNVDYCESNPETGYAINVAGTCHMVQAANRVGAKLVFLSSDYVFDGENGPYSETDLTLPICEYGRQKLFSEHYIALHSNDYIIARTTVVYGWESQGKNFIYRLISTLSKAETLRVPEDQLGSPTYAPNLAEALVEMAETGQTGLFHVCGPQAVSRYEFALEAAKTFGLDPSLIQPMSTDNLGQGASRPLKAGMKTNKAQSVLKVQLQDYKAGLQTMKAIRPNQDLAE